MNSDLISRSALIKALNEAQIEFDEYYKGLGKAKVITDNAPTVEPPKQLVLRARDDAEIEQLKMAWGKGDINFTPIVAWIERPQGEWVRVIDYSDEYEKRWHYECSECKNAPYYCGEIYKLHFCPNCGADMRGKNNVKEETT